MHPLTQVSSDVQDWQKMSYVAKGAFWEAKDILQQPNVNHILRCLGHSRITPLLIVTLSTVLSLI